MVVERPKVSSSSKESSPELLRNGGESNKFVAKRPSVTKIEDRLVNFELKSSTTENGEHQSNGQVKKDLPKVDINKRREMFEKEQTPDKGNRSSGDFGQATPIMSIKERLSHLEKQKEEANSTNSAQQRLPGEITSIKDRLRNLEKEKEASVATASPKIDVPIGGSIKDRLSSLHSAKSGGADTEETPSPNTTATITTTSTKSAVVVGMAKKPEAPVEFDQVIEVSTLKIEIEQIELATRTAAAAPVETMTTTAEPESLMALDSSIQDAVQDYVTIVQDMKEKEEYREITDEDLFGGTDIDMELDQLQQQDASVSCSAATVTAVEAASGGGSVVESADSLEDVSQLQGAPVIDTLTVLGDLLERSASNHSLSGSSSLVGGGGAGERSTVEEAKKEVEEVEVSQRKEVGLLNSSKPSNQKNGAVATPRVKGVFPQSRSENCLSGSNNNKHLKNQNHPTAEESSSERLPLRASQSTFFDTNSGDRYCVLLINNSRR